jgi:hypothetical protein
MGAMLLTDAFDIVFACGIGIAALALAGAALGFLPRLALVALASFELGAAIGAWLAFALRHSHPRELAIAAGGLLGCTLAASAAIVLRRALVQAKQTDAHFAKAQAGLQTLVEREAEARAAELERTLARARADSVSLLAEEERKLGEEHRRELAEREHTFAASLTEALTNTQTQVEQRLAGWAQDLDRAAQTTKLHIADLSHRQKQLVSDAELRLAADAERLAAESEELRAALQRLRVELDKALEEVLAGAHTEVESHAAERRRSLHELDERMRRRERELMERIQREEAEAAQRINAGFEEVQRKQIEQLQRIVDRTTSTYSDDAAQQFAALIKSSREDAARRLSRELDRAVEVFAREAEAVLAERLAHVGDAGAQRLERRLDEATDALERRRDERLGALDERIEGLEADIRRRLEELGADAEAERAVIEARLQELLRRVESAGELESTQRTS